MKGRNLVIWIVSIILVILVGLYLVLTSGDRKRFNWRETYQKDSEQPYGTSILFTLMKDFYPDHTLEISKSPLRNIDNWQDALNYLAIGEEVYYSDEDLFKLLGIVEQGNHALIISKYPPTSLLDNIAYGDCYQHFFNDYYKEEAQLNFNDSTLSSNQGYEYYFKVQDLVREYTWNYYDSMECDNAIVPLGTLDTLVNYIQIPYGDGSFLLHSVPLAFTNLHLLDESSVEYVEKVFSYLPPATIYWDEHSRISLFGNGSNRSTDSPLAYIMGQRSLRWGWYLILALVVLYVLSFSKRKQKVIPVLEANENTSIEFTETIGELYYQHQNHKKLGLLKMKLFLEYIRNHYQINTNHLDQALVRKISVKSEIPEEQVNRIFTMHQRMLDAPEVTDYLLIEFNRALEYFYENCK